MDDFRSLTKVDEFRCILLVHDLEARKKFYKGVFDWPVIEDWGGGILFDTGAAVLELIQDYSAGKPKLKTQKDFQLQFLPPRKINIDLWTKK